MFNTKKANNTSESKLVKRMRIEIDRYYPNDAFTDTARARLLLLFNRFVHVLADSNLPQKFERTMVSSRKNERLEQEAIAQNNPQRAKQLKQEIAHQRKKAFGFVKDAFMLIYSTALHWQEPQKYTQKTGLDFILSYWHKQIFFAQKLALHESSSPRNQGEKP